MKVIGGNRVELRANLTGYSVELNGVCINWHPNSLLPHEDCAAQNKAQVDFDILCRALKS